MRYIISEISVLMRRELKKWYRSRALLLITMVQPIMWLGLFGKAMNITGLLAIPEDIVNQLPPYVTSQLGVLFNRIVEDFFGVGGMDYFSYMSIGMITVIILFTSMFSGMSLVFDRRLGFLYKLLAAPITRSSILLSKVFAGMVRGLIQALLIFFIALAFGLKLNPADPLTIVLAILSVIFLSLGLSSMFIALTSNVKSWEAHVAIMNLLNLPLMFSSNVLYPTKLMPEWLKPVASANPLSFAADALRQASLYGSTAKFGTILFSFEVLLIFAISGTLLCAAIAEKTLGEG